jgi:hypothetical protein
MATDLKSFQARLNSDKAFRSDFLKDPVKAFEAVGLVLPDSATKELEELVRHLTKKQESVAGSTLEKFPWDIRVAIHHP